MAIEKYFLSIDMCEGKTLCKTVGRSPAARDGDGEHQDEVAIALQERNRKMSIFEVWNFFQEASEVGISLDKLAAVRKRDQSGGIESSANSKGPKESLKSRPKVEGNAMNAMKAMKHRGKFKIRDFEGIRYAWRPGKESSAPQQVLRRFSGLSLP